MKIEIEKHVKWSQSNGASTEYFIKVDGVYVAVEYNEEKAREMAQKVKDTYVPSSKEIIHTEEI